MSLTTIDKQDVRQMIKDGIETSPIILRMESVINRLDSSIGQLSKSFDSSIVELNTKMDSSLNSVITSIYRLEVLYEDSSHKIESILEAVSTYSDTSGKVTNHDLRLQEIELKQPMIIKTLALHSKQLGAKS